MCFNRIRTHDLHDTSAMLYRLSYDALLVVGKKELNLYLLYEEKEMMCI